jgi:hypothetical protein
MSEQFPHNPEANAPRFNQEVLERGDVIKFHASPMQKPLGDELFDAANGDVLALIDLPLELDANAEMKTMRVGLIDYGENWGTKSAFQFELDGSVIKIHSPTQRYCLVAQQHDPTEGELPVGVGLTINKQSVLGRRSIKNGGTYESDQLGLDRLAAPYMSREHLGISVIKNPDDNYPQILLEQIGQNSTAISHGGATLSFEGDYDVKPFEGAASWTS